MPWWLVKQIRRAVRKIAQKVGAVSPYDFYDWRVPWASKKDIQQDRERYNALNTDGRFVIDSRIYLSFLAKQNFSNLRVCKMLQFLRFKMIIIIESERFQVMLKKLCIHIFIFLRVF